MASGSARSEFPRGVYQKGKQLPFLILTIERLQFTPSIAFWRLRGCTAVLPDTAHERYLCIGQYSPRMQRRGDQPGQWFRLTLS